MNFLAHLHLAAPDRGLMLGGILADLLKPVEIASLPTDVVEGVRLHRLIDGFTDRHPVVQRSIRRVSAGLGWFSGIVVDVYYDHLLARTWDEYAAGPLRSFADHCYALFRDAAPGLPAEGQRFAHHFAADDRLVRYGTTDGIAETLDRVSARIAARMPTRAVRLRDAMPALLAADAELAADFRVFYPELIAYATAEREARQ
ncbi:MAG: ACP phosphodiesterase [Gemmataceae bacterium]